MQDLREALGDFMRERGYTQSEVARALGVSQPSISRALKRGSVRLGPAAKKIRQGLLAAASAPESTKPHPEYSSIQDKRAGLKRITERLRSLPDMEAVALDKMLAARSRHLKGLRGRVGKDRGPPNDKKAPDPRGTGGE